ncbi:DNA-directed RNA polymerase subunit beta' [Candidatus Parcubacteria bacterium]|nr:DNA-directed RNA polymerase subunit beta' [Candidatus Parcubacteria bacterium]
MKVSDLESIRIKIASPDDVLSWSHGEVTKPETINYRTQRAEKDGLFCEKIFGPEKDYECYCGKYKRIRYKGVVCDKCGVEVTKSSVRRERMGHIKLACPVSHIWFLRGLPSRMGMVLDLPTQQIEKVIYFASYVVTSVCEDAKKEVLKDIEKEYKQRVKLKKGEIKNKKELETALDGLKKARDRAKAEVAELQYLKILSEVEYNDLSFKYGQVFEAGTGSEVLQKIFAEIDLKKTAEELKDAAAEALPVNRVKILRRSKLLRGMLRAKIRPEWMFLTVLPVLSPDLRPMVQLDGGRYASSDLNDLYRRIINRNNRLKYLLEISAPEVIVRNEKRMLQEAVDALIDNGMRKGIMTQATTGGRRLLKSLADMIKGKQGRFRQNLLGKRVDYSARSVIVVGPNLKLSQCGLPKKMALELFKPFVIKKILDKELAYNVRGASKLIEDKTDEVWAILEEVVAGKKVLLNRAPTLHRLGIQAFQPVLMEGEAIRLHPLTCKAFNADFDGDQMPVHLPLSDEAQKEATEIMLSAVNLLKPATGKPIITPTNDIVLGCFWLTRIKESALGEGKLFGSKNEAILAWDTGAIDLRASIKLRIKEGEIIDTSVGRVLFNGSLPHGHPFVNEETDSSKLAQVAADVVENYDYAICEECLDKIKELGFEYSTISSITWGMTDLIVPKEKPKLVAEAEQKVEIIEDYYKRGSLSAEEKNTQIIEIWQQTKSTIEKLVPAGLPKLGPVNSIVSSGARGSWSQSVQMSGMKGLVINPAGQIIELPIKSSYKEGFNVLEYFISTHGARKGTADTALRTSTAGYLTRRLVDVAHEVIVGKEDCGDKEGIEVLLEDSKALSQNFFFKISGRVCLEEIKGIVKKGEIIDNDKAQAIIKAGIEKVKVRSPLSCKMPKGICQKCYGWDLGNNKLVRLGMAVGVVAAQAIGEPGTQLTMRTFHSGGVAGGGDITMGLPRVQEIFEMRIPPTKAEISAVDGKVVEITKEGVIKIKPNEIKKTKKEELVEYKIASRMKLWVKKGDEIKKGQQLCEGSLDIKEVFKIKGAEETKKHIISEIQKIYVSQGVGIHDKHFEVIVRQMFSRVRIKKPGDSSFLPGEIIEPFRFAEENEALTSEKQKLAEGVPVLLGITKVALSTDSFLSAASFQETSRVLIKAALEGKKDELRGLKENVIIGKLIPAGTGFKK